MADQQPRSEDNFESLLAARHEALVQGNLESEASTPGSSRSRLERAEACLQALEDLRRADLEETNGSAKDAEWYLQGESEHSVPGVGGGRVASVFGRFQIERELGRGGQGFVYLARDPTLDRQVALKIPRPEAVATPELRARFLREARAAADFDHPHLVTVYESGCVGPVCFIASRYCKGPNLAEWLRVQPTPVPVALAAELVAQLAEAVEYIHAHGILHRDLKPSNVLMEGCGQRIHPRITDFGLAKVREATGDSTQTGALLGTPQYMAPEQAASRLSEVGPHTDVYGLGIILYELLTGRPPFRGNTHLETLQQVISQSAVSPRSIRPDVPRDLETICMKAIAREPERRYGSAANFADDLHRFSANEPVLARPVGRLESLLRWCLRNRVVASLLALSILLLVSLVAAGAIFSLVYRAERDYAKRQEQSASHQRDRAIQETRIAARNLYAANLRLAQRELQLGNLERVVSLLDSHRPTPGAADLRGFEWYYLWQQCHRDLVLRGHRGEVAALQFRASGEVISAGADGTIATWDAQTGRRRTTLNGHSSPVQSVAVVPAAGLLFSGDDMGSIRMWDIDAGLCLRVLQGHRGGVTSLAVSPEGRRIASASWDNTVRVWNLESGSEEIILRGGNGERPGREMFVSVAWSHDGDVVIAASLFSDVFFWNSATGNQIAVLSAHRGNLSGLAVSPDGRTLATASEDSTVKLWDLATLTENRSDIAQFIENGAGNRGARATAEAAVLDSGIALSPSATLKGHTGSITQVAFSPDGRSVATSGADELVCTWDAATGARTGMFRGHTGSVSCVAFAPDGRTLASGSNDRTIRVWDVVTGQAQRTPTVNRSDRWRNAGPRSLIAKADRLEFAPMESQVHTLAFSSDSRLLAVGGQRLRDELSTESLTLWELQTGKQLAQLKSPSLFVRGLCFGDGERRLIANAQTSRGIARVVLCDLTTGEEEPLFTDETGSIWALAKTPDCSKIYAATGLMHQWGSVVEIDLVARQTRVLYRKEGDYVRALALSADGRTLAAATGEGEVLVWRDGCDSPRSFCAHHQRIFQIGFAPDGQRFATASRDATAKIWDCTSLTQTGVLVGHTHSVTAVAWSIDGESVATGSSDGKVKLWDPHINQERISIESEPVAVWSLAFSEDGSMLAAGTENGSVLLFDASGAFDSAVESRDTGLSGLTPIEQSAKSTDAKDE